MFLFILYINHPDIKKEGHIKKVSCVISSEFDEERGEHVEVEMEFYVFN